MAKLGLALAALFGGLGVVCGWEARKCPQEAKKVDSCGSCNAFTSTNPAPPPDWFYASTVTNAALGVGDCPACSFRIHAACQTPFSGTGKGIVIEDDDGNYWEDLGGPDTANHVVDTDVIEIACGGDQRFKCITVGGFYVVDHVIGGQRECWELQCFKCQ